MDNLPEELLVEILKYIFQDPDENYRFLYHSNIICLNLVNKNFNNIINKYKKIILGEYFPICWHLSQKSDYVSQRIINIVHGRLDFVPDNKLEITEYRKYKDELIKCLIHLRTTI